MLQYAMNVEIELKLKVPLSSLAGLHRHPLFKSAGRTARLVSVYFDTPELDLKSKGIALRLRKAGKSWIQTIKGGGGMLAGVHTRNEWEFPVARNALDFTKLEDPFLVDIFGNAEFRAKLEPVFMTEFTRKTIPVEFGGNLIEYCFDRGRVVSGEREEAISEVELELKSGNPAALFEFALALETAAPLFIEGRSKAERGYALYLGGAFNSVKKAWIVELSRKMDTGEACREIVRGCLEQIQLNMQGFLDREKDCEYLHQIRVGLRRMRSAFSIFSRHYGRDPFSVIVPELRWLGGELGPARNWDVFAFETLPPISGAFPGQYGLADLQEAVEQVREKNNLRALEAVSSQRFQILLLNLGAALCSTSWPRGNALPVADFAEKILERRYRSFARGGRNIEKLSHPELHALRISGKKLRYAAEFFSPLYPAHASRIFLKAMAGIQDVLGAINDAATTNHLVDELSDIGGETRCLVRGWVGCDTGHRLSQAGLHWKAFRNIVPFWR